MLRFSGRLFDVERKIRLVLTSLIAGADTSSSSSSQLADLAPEVERLHSLLRSTLELIRANIRSLRDYVSSDLEGLRVLMRATLSQLDAIRTQLQSRPFVSTEPIFVQPIAFHPSISSTRIRSSNRG